MESNILRSVKTIAFILIFFILFSVASDIFLGHEGTNFQQLFGFCNEKEGALDAVYIGASPAYTSWITPIAWGKYGIAVRTFANDTQPFAATEYFLRIAAKKQPNSVYLIAINGVYSEKGVTVEGLHRTIDFFPKGIEKCCLLNTLSNAFDSTAEEKLELVFPLIRYHSRWNTLKESSFHKTLFAGGVNTEDDFLIGHEDISSKYTSTDESVPPPEYIQVALSNLLAYCKEENLNVVFVLSAQYRYFSNEHKWYNAMMKQIEDSGFPLVNEMKDFGLIGLDDKKDFYNVNHTNIHGALKITDYLAQYLMKEYGFTDKRNDPAYEEWNETYDEYKEYIMPYLTRDELLSLP